jgi:predicted MFS family arabinose efflux permease
VFLVLIVCWGLYMGAATTLVRSIVQEQAPDASRAQILTVLTLSFMLASPISAWGLGLLVSWTSPLTSLSAGILTAASILVIGITLSRLWRYESPASEA